MLNYYPQHNDFEVLNPDKVIEHFSDLVSYFPDKDIWIPEVGYQSGTEYCNSSESKQAEFLSSPIYSMG
jgi:beta-mannanase